jgi:hypothetical protein
MNNIFDTDSTFKFENVSMTTPTSVGSGTFFSKIFVNRSPLYIQSPKCKTRQGIVQSGKKIHADLVFTNDDEEFIQWMESLEQTVKKHIYNNRSKWFDTDMDEDDVDSYMTPAMKFVKSGKQCLLRVNVSQRIGTAPLKIYDEDEQTIEMNSINETTFMITILEIQGVRCSSKSFQIDIELKQVMVLKPVNLFEKCIIKTQTKSIQQPLEQEPFQNGLPQKDLVRSLEPIVDNVIQHEEDKILPEDKVLLEEPDYIRRVPDTRAGLISSRGLIAFGGTLDSEPTTSAPMPLEPLAKNEEIEEFDLNIETMENSDTVHLKEKTEVYYQMYREAKQKAKLAKSLALSSYMEARRIKNLYMLDDNIDSSDDEFDLDNLEQAELQ